MGGETLTSPLDIIIDIFMDFYITDIRRKKSKLWVLYVSTSTMEGINREERLISVGWFRPMGYAGESDARDEQMIPPAEGSVSRRVRVTITAHPLVLDDASFD